MNYTCLQLFHWLTPSIETDVPILDYYHDRVWKAISCCKFQWMWSVYLHSVFICINCIKHDTYMPHPMQNLLQDECIVQLYLKPINAFLGINKPGQLITTPYSTNAESELFNSLSYKMYTITNYVLEKFHVEVCACE